MTAGSSKSSQPQRARRSTGLDGLRGLAALSVLVFHVWLYRDNRPKGGHRTALFDQVMFALHLGLICFFVLSGYLLYRAFSRAALQPSGRVGTRDYARRRLARIVPAYYVSIVGCIAMYAIVGYNKGIPSLNELPLFFLFAQTYSKSTQWVLNPVTWTLCVEMAFYILLPLLGWLAIRFGRGHAGRQVLMLVSLIAITITWNGMVHWETWGLSAPRRWLPSFLGHFALGMLAALWVTLRRERKAPPLGSVVSVLLLLVGAALVVINAAWQEDPTTLPDLRMLLTDLPAAAGFALIIAAVVCGSGRATRAVGVKPLAALGVISYGVYLWHLPLILALRQLGLLPEYFPPRLLIVLGVSIIAGLISWRVFERPVINWEARRESFTPDRPLKRTL